MKQNHSLTHGALIFQNIYYQYLKMKKTLTETAGFLCNNLLKIIALLIFKYGINNLIFKTV